MLVARKICFRSQLIHHGGSFSWLKQSRFSLFVLTPVPMQSATNKAAPFQTLRSFTCSSLLLRFPLFLRDAVISFNLRSVFCYQCYRSDETRVTRDAWKVETMHVKSKIPPDSWSSKIRSREFWTKTMRKRRKHHLSFVNQFTNCNVPRGFLNNQQRTKFITSVLQRSSSLRSTDTRKSDKSSTHIPIIPETRQYRDVKQSETFGDHWLFFKTDNSK